MRFNIETASNAEWSSAGHESILLTVKFTEFDDVLPFLARFDDSEEHGRELYKRAVAGDFGPITPYVPPAITPAQFQQGIVNVVQKRLDDFAKTRGYDGILSACTYATSGVPKFAAEGQYCVAARDATWGALYTLLDDVQAGKWQMPTEFADVEPLLPVLGWPA